MFTLNCFTNGFAGQASSVWGKVPRRMRWEFYQRPWAGVTVFEDGHMREYGLERAGLGMRVGWLHEARTLHPENYEWAWEQRRAFDFVLTDDADLLQRDSEQFRFCIRGGVWVPRAEWGLRPKARTLGMMISSKRATPAHQLRHRIVEELGVSAFGLNGFVSKVEALGPCYFAIVVEEPCANRFTENLLDAIALGCIPIYSGAPNIDEFLDARGILTFRTLDELSWLLGELSMSLYEQMLPYAVENLKRLDEYEVTEDWMVTHPLKDIPLKDMLQ